jgi:hypothetical protein
MWFLSRLIGSPFSFGIISSTLFVCGLIAIGNLLAPALVEQYLPDWQTRFGTLIAGGVVLGFVRSAWRLVVPVCALAFWIVALGAVLGGPLSHRLPTISALEEAASSEHGKIAGLLRELPVPELVKRLLK